MSNLHNTTPAPVAGTVSELRARLVALQSDAIRAALSNCITPTPGGGFRCPPLCEDWTMDVAHSDVLGEWLALSLEVARRGECERDAVSGAQTEPLELPDAFRLLWQVARSDARGLMGDHACEAVKINRTRAAFAQVRGQLLELESDFETHVSQEVERLHSEMQSITNRGRN